MYIKSVQITNIRSIESLQWSVPRSKFAGWHVLIGDNGSGKSSVLRAIALALVGPSEAMALRQDWSRWLRHGESRGRVRLDIQSDEELDRFSGRGARVKNYYLPCEVRLQHLAGQGVKVVRPKLQHDPGRHVWSGKSGWFSAAYGPFRRFVGGDKDVEKLFYADPRLARHLSVFGEGIALSECLSWLQSLQFKKLEAQQRGEDADHPDIRLLEQIRQFVNESNFLPHNTKIERITSDAVIFVDGNGCHIPVEELSDGYRSILSMTFELIRQLVAGYGVDRVFDRDDPTLITAPGVVLIDEIDAHLHPVWQRRIGSWLCRHFSRIQFIVTTHSPLICQGGDHSTVYRLPRPGEPSGGGMLTGPVLDRLLYGNVLDAYGTGAFGDDVTRSKAGHKLLLRLARLNQKERRGPLTRAEKQEVAKLRNSLPTTAYTVDEEP